MTDHNEIARLRVEAEQIRSQMELSRQEIRAGIEELHQKKLESRKLPPMSQMTRIQKSYFLEPWYTVGMTVGFTIAVVAFTLAAFLPWHVEAASMGGLWALVGAGFGVAKYMHREQNMKTEGQIAGTNANGHGTSCRCSRCY